MVVAGAGLRPSDWYWSLNRAVLRGRHFAPSMVCRSGHWITIAGIVGQGRWASIGAGSGEPDTSGGVGERYPSEQRKEEADAKRNQLGWKARRWVVERTHSWLNRYRKLLVSFEKTEASYVALLSLAAALICWRQTMSIYG